MVIYIRVSHSDLRTLGDRYSWVLLFANGRGVSACSDWDRRLDAEDTIFRRAIGWAAMLLILFSGSLIGKKESDAVRTETVYQVVNHITPLSIILGNGLGVGVEAKPAHMENSYLEIFHKQGALGLLWWGSLFILLFTRYKKARRVNYLYAQPLLLSAIFVAFESLTNPYINNPIGIFAVLIALTGFDVVSVDPPSAALLGQMELATS